VAAQPSAPDLSSVPDTSKVIVPSLNRDPVQSLQPWAVVVHCAGADVEIPALPATDWLAVLMADPVQFDDIFPGFLSPDDEAWVEEQILHGALDFDEFRETALAILETVSARRWWVTLRLVGVMKGSWDVLGSRLILRGVDASKLSLSAWLDIALITILENMEPKDTQMFTMRLERAPDEEDQPEPEPEMDSSAFLALGRD
jgi:hypothetical protein